MSYSSVLSSFETNKRNRSDRSDSSSSEKPDSKKNKELSLSSSFNYTMSAVSPQNNSPFLAMTSTPSCSGNPIMSIPMSTPGSMLTCTPVPQVATPMSGQMPVHIPPPPNPSMMTVEGNAYPVSLSDHDIQRVAASVFALTQHQLQLMLHHAITPIQQELDSLKAENRELRLAIDEVEQYGRRPLVRFAGIPEPASSESDSSTSSSEDTTKLVLDVCTKANIPIAVDDIERSHRVGKPRKPIPGHSGNNKPRQIIVRLKSSDTKHVLLMHSSNFKNPEFKCEGISVNEDLTKLRDNLFYLARQLVKQKKLRKTWTTNGRIKVRDNKGNDHVIRDEPDLCAFGHVIKTMEDQP